MNFYYRKNGGEVIGQSTDYNWPTTDATYYGVLVNPTTQGGTNLGQPLIWTGTLLRNANAGEITAFVAAKDTDENLMRRKSAKDSLDSLMVQKTILRALIDALVDEINTLRAQHALAPRTLTQAINAIKNKIDAGTFD